jgi:hypothetical protein
MLRVLALATTVGALTAALLSLPACDGSGSKKPTASLTLNPVALSVAPGAQGMVTVTLTRGGGFGAAVDIAATGAPAGVTVSAVRIAGGGTSGDLAIVVAATATPGTTTLSVNATASGVTIAPQELALTITDSTGGTMAQLGTGIEGEMANDESGGAVDLSADGKRVVIGSPLNDGTGVEAGHARVFEFNGTAWVQVGADIDGEAAGDRSGFSVAISDDGNRVAVGAWLNDGGGTSSGHVRIYDYDGSAWTQVGADLDGGPSNAAGDTVGLSASGHRVVIGGPSQNSIMGHAWVYELTGGTWTQVGATLADTFEYGEAVSISDDGNRIAVGQPGSVSMNRAGFVYVYDWNGTAWAPVGAAIEGETLGDVFGGAVSLSGDGSMLAVGAVRGMTAGEGGRGGHLRVYRLTGGAWTQVGADLDGVTGDQFGTAVALSRDGTRVIGGGPGGSIARAYTLVGDVWTEVTTPMFVKDTKAGDGVALSADGRRAAVGAPYFRGVAGSATGVVRVYALP